MIRILLSILILSMTFQSQGQCTVNWNKAIPAVGDSKSLWPGQVTAQWSILDMLISNYRRGEKVIFKNSTTLTVASGEVVVSNSGGSLRLFLQDAGNTDITSANLDSGGSFSASTQYYVYSATSSTTATTSTYYISSSSSAPTGPTYYVQLGSFITDGSANIISNKVYSTIYGAINADAIGQPQVQAIYNYAGSSSAFTLKTAGLLTAYGQTGSIGGNSSVTISNLPFSSSTSYSVSTGQYSSFNCAISSKTATQFVITNTHSDNSGGNGNCDWIAVGY